MDLMIESFDSIVTRPTQWIWPGWLAAGTLHLLAGEAGSGKSGVLVNLAATVSCGGVFPDRSTRAEEGEVLIYASEDSAATIKSRLIAAGANLANVMTISGVRDGEYSFRFQPRQYLDQLRNTLIDARPQLVILDPITSFAVSQGGQSIRDVLEELADIADKSGAAIIGITHFAKATGNRPVLERVLNSQAYTAVPRMVLVTGNGKRSGEKTIVRAKSNICEVGNDFEYRIYEEQVVIDGQQANTTMIAWVAEVEGSADDILCTGKSVVAERPLQAAKAFLGAVLNAGPLAMTSVMNQAIHAGHSQKTIKRAKTELSIISYWEGRVSFWKLPSHPAPSGQEVQQDHYLN